MILSAAVAEPPEGVAPRDGGTGGSGAHVAPPRPALEARAQCGISVRGITTGRSGPPSSSRPIVRWQPREIPPGHAGRGLGGTLAPGCAAGSNPASAFLVTTGLTSLLLTTIIFASNSKSVGRQQPNNWYH